MPYLCTILLFTLHDINTNLLGISSDPKQDVYESLIVDISQLFHCERNGTFWQPFRLLSLLMARSSTTVLLSSKLALDDYAYLPLVFVGQLRQDHNRVVANAFDLLAHTIVLDTTAFNFFNI